MEYLNIEGELWNVLVVWIPETTVSRNLDIQIDLLLKDTPCRSPQTVGNIKLKETCVPRPLTDPPISASFNH